MGRTTPPSTRSVFLGLFVVGQLLFLFVRNGLEALEQLREHLPPAWKDVTQRIAPGWHEDEGHFSSFLRMINRLTRSYAQATEQLQQWSLFSNAGRECVFPAIELRWDEDPPQPLAVKNPLALLAAGDPVQALTAALAAGPTPGLPPAGEREMARRVCLLSAATPWEVVALSAGTLYVNVKPREAPLPPVFLLSDNEPADVTNFVRLGRYRVRKLEENLTLSLRINDEDTNQPPNERWAAWIGDHVQANEIMLHGYLRWRLEEYGRLHGSLPPPTQVILWQRHYRINRPEDAPPYIQLVVQMPIARWRLQASDDGRSVVLERWDPVTKTFRARQK